MLRALLLLVALVTAGCLTGPIDARPEADIVILDATIWSAGTEPRVANVAIAGDTILDVGFDAGKYAGEPERVIDAAGRLIVPGFRDAHMHFVPGADLRPWMDDRTQQEMLEDDLQNHAGQVAFHGGRRAHHEAGDFDPDSAAEYGYCTPPDEAAVSGRIAAHKAFEAQAAAQGISTLVVAGMRDLTDWVALKQMEAAGENKVRWLIRTVSGCYDHMDALGAVPHDGDWVRWYGVKLYGDGYLGAWVAALQDAYNDRPLWNGILAYTPTALDHYIAQAKARGLNIGTHAIGDATIHQVLDAYERAGVTPADRWVIEHVQVTTPDIIGRFAELGVIPSIQLSFATSDIRMAADRLGERLADAYDWQAFVQAGVPIAGGTDYPVEVITPTWGLQREVTRQELDGKPEGGWYKDNSLDLPQALESITAGAAFAAHEDDRGRIEAGAKADLVILERDLFAIAPTSIHDTAVLATITNGQITFEGETRFSQG